MTEKAIQEQIQEQINGLVETTNKAVKSKQSAIKYLKESGIIDKVEEDDEETPENPQNHHAATSAISDNRISQL